MTLRAAVRDLLNQPEPLRISPSLANEPRLVRREAEVTAKFGLGGALRPPPDIDAISDRLSRALRHSPGSVSPRDLRYAPLCIWSSSTPIAENPVLLKRLLEQLARAGKRSLIRGLAAAYFRWFSPDRLGIEIVGAVLALMVEDNLPVLADMHQQFSIFNPEHGPSRVAEACLAHSQPPLEFMQGYGLAAHALVTGFGAAVFGEGMKRIQREFGTDPRHDLVQLARQWIEEPLELSYPAANLILAETLLLPFQSRDPSEEIKDEILETLLGRIGDPRTKKGNWVRMPQAAEVARRWLTRLALQQFLDIVDDVAFRDHWDYRRAFWLAFYEKGYIQEAWVAFGPTGADKARRNFGRNASFGRLQSSRKPVEHGHAVLLMRIGDYTVVDWSHNGRCIIWPTSNSDSPKLYEAKYLSGHLAPPWAPEGGFEKSHLGSPRYSWQRDVAAFLRKKTGLSVSDRDFAVR